MPERAANRISSSVLLLPCMWMRAGSKPARSAMCSSPPEATSTESPSSAKSR